MTIGSNSFVIASAGTIVRADGRVLMIHRQKEPYKGLWAMPGGKMEEGEHPGAAIIREFREETGLKVSIDRFCGTVSEIYRGAHGGSHFLMHVFRLKVDGGDLVESDEGPLQWLRPEELPGLAIPVDAWVIRNMILAPESPRLVALQGTATDVVIDEVFL